VVAQHAKAGWNASALPELEQDPGSSSVR
jgi:hypothetical protein